MKTSPTTRSITLWLRIPMIEKEEKTARRTQLTWIHKESNDVNSFFKLSRIIPNIFSTYAVSCCLNSKAGYLASTWRTTLSADPRLLEEGDERKP